MYSTNLNRMFFYKCCYFFGYRRRTMPSACASDTDSKIRLALFYIERDEKIKKPFQPLDKFFCLRLLKNKFFNRRVYAPQFFKFRHEVWIWNKPHIKEKVNVLGNAKLISERHKR